MRRAVLLWLVLPAGCGSQGAPVGEPPPAGARAWPAAYLSRGDRFGYAGIQVGVGGITGQNDIRPGPSWTVVLPPGGVMLTAVSAVLFCGGLALDGTMIAAGASDDLFFTYLGAGGAGLLMENAEEAFQQGAFVGEPRPLHLEAFSVDLYAAGSYNRDLTYGGGVNTLGCGLCLTLAAGLFEGGRGRLRLGYEYRHLDFDNRPAAHNYGPMAGVGLETAAGLNTAVSADFRYAFTTGDTPEYDLWDFSVGLSIYW